MIQYKLRNTVFESCLSKKKKKKNPCKKGMLSAIQHTATRVTEKMAIDIGNKDYEQPSYQYQCCDTATPAVAVSHLG